MANGFKEQRKWLEAGEEFKAAAELCEGLEAANRLNDAAVCFRKVDTKRALECYRKAARMMKEVGRFSSAARLYEEAGEMTEKVAELRGEAPGLFEEAAATFSDEGSVASAADCFAKAGAAAASSVGDFNEAARLFARACDEAAKDEILRFPAVNHCLKACLCALLCEADNDGRRRKIEALKMQSREFNGSSECELVEQLLVAEQPEQHDMAVENFGRFNACDNTVELLLKRLRLRLSSDTPQLS